MTADPLGELCSSASALRTARMRRAGSVEGLGALRFSHLFNSARFRGNAHC